MPRESLTAKRARAAAVLDGLRRLYPDAKTELDFVTPFQLLIATLLSAQATDVSVNAATPALFARYPTPETLAPAAPEDVEPYIKTIGLYRNKAKNAVAAARRLVEAYGGEVPRTVEELVTLPGVGRKTANVVVSNAYGVPAIAVDTHVGRLARRLGFSKHTDPDKVEADLQKLFAPEGWVCVHHGLILHSRRVCAARKPNCTGCGLAPLCPSRVD
ncbi:MAG: endonuclease III [Trueperaceae bacterium]|nr:endonuclease III [Trueperaceae bacterium]